MRRGLVTLTMLAVLLAALAIAPPAAFPHARGWHVGAARIRSTGCTRCVQVDSWASTVRYRDPPNDVPQRTMTALGPRDSILFVLRSWQPAPPRWTLERHPLRIERSAIHAGFEGNPTKGRVSMWAGTTWRGGSFVQVYAYFGSPQPSVATDARTQRELDAARFPRWTIRR